MDNHCGPNDAHKPFLNPAAAMLRQSCGVVMRNI